MGSAFARHAKTAQTYKRTKPRGGMVSPCNLSCPRRWNMR